MRAIRIWRRWRTRVLWLAALTLAWCVLVAASVPVVLWRTGGWGGRERHEGLTALPMMPPMGGSKQWSREIWHGLGRTDVEAQVQDFSVMSMGFYWPAPSEPWPMGWSETAFRPASELPVFASVTESAVGWPMPMVVKWTREETVRAPGTPWWNEPDVAHGTRLWWPGVAMNAGFGIGGVLAASSMWWGMVAVRDALRLRRWRRRGLCAGCGYALVGCRGDVCPECGRRVKEAGEAVANRQNT